MAFIYRNKLDKFIVQTYIAFFTSSSYFQRFEWVGSLFVLLTITLSLISFGVIRDDLVTSTMECAESGTVAIYKAGTRDFDVEEQAHRGKNSQHAWHHFH